MHSKLAFAGLLASVAVFPALAQHAPTPAPSTPSQRMETTTTKSTTGQWRASKLVGVDVYNSANEKIGDISEILLDRSGKSTGVIISVGGFLGTAQHDVMVQMDQLKFVNEPARATTAKTTTTTTTTGAATTTRPTRAANEMWYPDHAVMNATKDQLKAMPAFKYN